MARLRHFEISIDQEQAITPGAGPEQSQDQAEARAMTTGVQSSQKPTAIHAIITPISQIAMPRERVEAG